MRTIDLIVGARPNFVKVAPVYRALRGLGAPVVLRLVHTGQHYDVNMSDTFFEQLRIPSPDVSLGVGSGEHGAQTAAIMAAYERTLLSARPNLVLVFGDVNSTLACSLAAVKQGVRVGHVEAGLRSFDRSMPEEINRVVTDHVCELLFTPSVDGSQNLVREGIAGEKIHLVGNVMIDTLVDALPQIEQSAVLGRLGVRPRQFGVLTLHRPSNVDENGSMADMLDTLAVIQAHVPLVFPVHPRTRRRLSAPAHRAALERLDRVQFLDPLPYWDFMRLVSEAAFVLTDSGGIQEETTFLGIPCLTARANTERPITVSEGTNILVGSEPAAIVEAVRRILGGSRPKGRRPALWDGRAAERIAGIVDRETAGV